ncbi:TM2 domain-containing membrane protein YozV [Mycoplasmoides fastidiosum]|uniref:TM2 domain-containing membrane protein YozV n=1 Tax=Mycoplasmoides fastidiosum TaxID=92758 RepID=A0ABU0LZT8_9BACT|nr:NINE protein [Mycoplasmoides fastidiosum]MDQ0514223.1 TM2 domain-containing membrane protein YozV [Mycoplasmoides fastidiosum]UUD37369.1 TM2 domain-containing protein [Mycoplasmoides fastidiosum]
MSSSSSKSRILLILFSIFLGFFAVDRFYAGNLKIAILKFLSIFIGLIAIWWPIDIFLSIFGVVRDGNGNYI